MNAPEAPAPKDPSLLSNLYTHFNRLSPSLVAAGFTTLTATTAINQGRVYSLVSSLVGQATRQEIFGYVASIHLLATRGFEPLLGKIVIRKKSLRQEIKFALSHLLAGSAIGGAAFLALQKASPSIQQFVPNFSSTTKGFAASFVALTVVATLVSAVTKWLTRGNELRTNKLPGELTTKELLQLARTKTEERGIDQDSLNIGVELIACGNQIKLEGKKLEEGEGIEHASQERGPLAQLLKQLIALNLAKIEISRIKGEDPLLSSLAASLNTFRDQMEKHEVILATLNEQVNTIKNLERKKAGLKAKVEEAKVQYIALKQEAQNNVDQGRLYAMTLNTKLTSLENELARAKEEITRLESLREVLIDLKQAKLRVENELDRAKEEITRLEPLQEVLTDLEQAKLQVESELDLAKEEINTLGKTLNTTREALAKLESVKLEKINELLVANEEISKLRKVLDSQTESVRQGAVDAKARLDDLEGERVRLNSELDDASSKIAGLNDSIREIRGFANDKIQELEAANSKLEEANSKIEELEQKLAKINTTPEGLLLK